MLEINENNFDNVVLESKKPVLVDFWAPWCPPCRAMMPIIEKISEDMKDSVDVVKVNVEDNKELAARYSISAIPALIFFKDGKTKEFLLGVQTEEAIKEIFESLLNG